MFVSALSLNAHAGDYSRAVATEEQCQKIGKMAQMAYDVKKAGVSLEAFKTHLVNMPQTYQEASILGYEAPDSEAAYMRGWAKCKD